MQHDPDITAYLFENARDIILVIDVDSGRIIDVNAAAVRAYGYTREELLACTIFDLRVDADEASQQIRIADAQGMMFDTVHKRRDGSVFPVEVSSRGDILGDRDGGRRCLFSIVRDISERKRFESEREDLLTTTQRALSMRDDFLMIASHELRAPLTNVSLQLQNLQRLLDRGATRAHMRVLTTAAVRESARLTALIDALLDAQAARGNMKLDLVDLDLADLVTEVTDRLRPRAEAAGSELVLDVRSIRGKWDRLRIDQVLTNLLYNAFKFGRGRPVRVAAARSPTTALLEVTDQGIGVADADIHRIFGKFERAVPSHYGGLGLGLFIARQIVEAHNGRVEVTSTPGVGSTFRVMLPL